MTMIPIECTQCGKSYSAFADWAGSEVACPKCGRTNIVASPSEASGAASGRGEPPAPEQSREGSSPPPRPPKAGPAQPPAQPPKQDHAAKAEKSLDELSVDDLLLSPDGDEQRTVAQSDYASSLLNQAMQDLESASAPAAERRGAAGGESGGAAGRHRAASDDEAYLALDAPNRVGPDGYIEHSSLPAPPAYAAPRSGGAPCPNCQAPLPADGMLCDECGFHVQLGRTMQGEVDPSLPQHLGFDRWFRGQLSEGASPEIALGIAAALAALVIATLGVIFWPFSVVIVLPTIVAALLLGVGAVWELGQGEPAVPGVRRRAVMIGSPRWWQQTLWFLLLQILRAIGWGRSGERLVARSDPHWREILSDPERLREYRVIDLEGVEAGEAELGLLPHARRVYYVVLRGARLSPQFLHQVQLRLPDTWFWV